MRLEDFKGKSCDVCGRSANICFSRTRDNRHISWGCREHQEEAKRRAIEWALGKELN